MRGKKEDQDFFKLEEEGFVKLEEEGFKAKPNKKVVPRMRVKKEE